MSFFRFSSPVFLMGLLFLTCLNLNAQTVEQTVVTTPAPTTSPPSLPPQGSGTISIVSPVPAPKETIVTPTGYIKCTTIKAKWRHHVWVSEHRSCGYKKFPKSKIHKGTVWVDGYWICTKHKEDTCITWKWESGHWVKL